MSRSSRSSGNVEIRSVISEIIHETSIIPGTVIRFGNGQQSHGGCQPWPKNHPGNARSYSKFGFKLQFRNLDTFIHPDFRDRTDLKYIKRFSETRLGLDAMKRLRDEMEKFNFISICTPFDEASVDAIEQLNFDVIKIASCSFTDWPLLEKVSQSKKPIIASIAGSTLEDIDRVVSF